MTRSSTADSLLDSAVPAVSRRFGWWAAAGVGLLVLLYVAGWSPTWWVGKDSGLYLTLARNLNRGEGYTVGGQPHRIVPPGFPLLLAGLMRINPSFAFLNAAMAALGLAALGSTYLLLRQWVHRDWALLLTAAVGLTNEMHQRSGELLSDVPFTLLVISGLWMYARGLRADRPRRGLWELGSLLLMAAVTVRVAGMPLVAAAPLGLTLSAGRGGRRRALLNLALVWGVGLLTGAGLVLLLSRGRSGFAYAESLRTALTHLSPADYLRNLYQTGRDFSRLVTAQSMFPLLSLILLTLPAAAGMLLRLIRRERLGPIVLVAYVGGIGVMAPLRARYLLPLTPLLVMYLAEGYSLLFRGLSRLDRWTTAATQRRAHVGLTFLVLVVIAGLNLPLIGRNIYLKRRADYPRVQQRGRYRGLWGAVAYLRDHRPAEGTLLAEQSYGYLTDIPTPLQMPSLLAEDPEGPAMARLLARRRIRLVVVDFAADPEKPLQEALLRYFADAEPVYSGEGVRIYRVGPDGRPVPPGPPSRGGLSPSSAPAKRAMAPQSSRRAAGLSDRRHRREQARASAAG
jgi:hypothetical protein